MRACTCTDGAVARYRRRLSGPLLDRIDIHLEVPRVPYEKLAVQTVVQMAGAVGREDEGRRTNDEGGVISGAETSAQIRERVITARERQRARLEGSGLTCNAEMGPAEVRRFCRPEGAAETLLRAAMARLHLSARSYHRVLKLARTIADLDGADLIGAAHVAEALQYRPKQVE